MNVPTPMSHAAWDATPGPGRVLDRAAYIALCGFMFAVPWEESPQFGGFPIGRVLATAALALTLLRVVVSGQRRKLSRLHYWMTSLVVLSALSLLWTVDGDSTATRIGTYLQLLMVVWLIWELAATEARVVGLLRAYVLGIFLTSLLTIYNFMTGLTAVQQDATQGIEKWEEGRFSITGINENDLGLMLAMSIPMVIYLAIRTKGKAGRLLAWIELVASVTAILLTGSRGALVSAAVASLMLPLTIGRLPRSQKILAGLACAGAAACGIYLIPGGVWGRLLQISTELTQGTLTHRTVIWAAGAAAFRDHAFLGVGSGAYAATILRVVDVPYVAHNTFLSVLVELGVVGALLLAGLLASLFFTTFRMPYLEKCLWLTVLLSWSIGVMALTWEYRKPTWIMFGLLAAHAYARSVRAASFDERWARVPGRDERAMAVLAPAYQHGAAELS